MGGKKNVFASPQSCFSKGKAIIVPGQEGIFQVPMNTLKSNCPRFINAEAEVMLKLKSDDFASHKL